MEKLSQDLLDRLRMGDRPSRENRLDPEALREAAIALGIIHGAAVNETGNELGWAWWNSTICELNRIHPGWRGWDGEGIWTEEDVAA